MQSQRYVRENDFEVVVPPQIAEVPEAREEFELAMQESIAHYQKIAELLKARREKELLAEGLSPKAAASRAEKTAIEDARFVLPNACDTKMIVTMNARSLMNFFELRCCPVGDKRSGRPDAAAVPFRGAASFQKRGAGLCAGRLPGGQNDLRKSR